MSADRIKQQPVYEKDSQEVQVPLALRIKRDPSIAALVGQNRLSREMQLLNIDEAKRLLVEKAKRVANLRKVCTDPSTSSEDARMILAELFREELPDVDLDTPFKLPNGTEPTRRSIAENVLAERLPVHHDIVATMKDQYVANDQKRTFIKSRLVKLSNLKSDTDDHDAPGVLPLPVRGPTVRVLGYMDGLIAKSPHLKGAAQLVPESWFTDLTVRTGSKSIRR